MRTQQLPVRNEMDAGGRVAPTQHLQAQPDKLDDSGDLIPLVAGAVH